jgi:hypothetical protein
MAFLGWFFADSTPFCCPANPFAVMAGLVPAIHVALSLARTGVDARHEAGHDDSLM